ncbi:Glu/Leu/Phe/Val family dehydrogenase [Saccharopolyspora phatthalungensis]|uniref:Leucine dehydrogenase n=1 Tax=Saccharopolyspora phatthalungensis TaxID=664693 RepID=A0A840QK98_9PSEU|nr:Glu/Leu/Phe/Val dehydrogenase [Saccharopolyspora phatthalungensis]MBB5158703.1 leucine dehydrogenase [Saccharopolyspora phatthalungensis]
MSIIRDMAERDFEQLVVCRDRARGLRSVIAVHNTALGPALGGIRIKRYRTDVEAAQDAMNLAEAMTYKAALAGLRLGGGKSVINADPASQKTRDLLIAHAEYINTLGGRYIPAVDSGTTVADLALIADHVPLVSSQQRDPSYFTAIGVFSSMQAAVQQANLGELRGARVGVQGAGHVGMYLVELLADAGAKVVVADLDADRVRMACEKYGATAEDPAEILAADLDIAAPCGLGGTVDEQAAETMKAPVIVGAANNILADAGVADVLTRRGIVYVPDFIANAGGLMACEAELRCDDDGLEDRVRRIGDTAAQVLREAASTQCDTVSVALRFARERIAAAPAPAPGPYFPR